MKRNPSRGKQERGSEQQQPGRRGPPRKKTEPKQSTSRFGDGHKQETGRPAVAFDLRQVEAMAMLGCTIAEMAFSFGCAESTLYDRAANDPAFSEALKRGRANACVTVRRQQWALMNKGNPTMCIWLGKQMLGQKNDPSKSAGEPPPGAGGDGSGGAPPANKPMTVSDLDGLSDQELDVLEKLARRQLDTAGSHPGTEGQAKAA